MDIMEIILFIFSLFSSYIVVYSGEYCQFSNGNVTYCEHDCCGSWDNKKCCSFSTTTLILCVLAVTVILVVLTFVIIYCHQGKKKKKQLVRPVTSPQPTVAAVHKPGSSVSSVTYVVLPPGEPLYRVQDYPTSSLSSQPPPYSDVEKGSVTMSPSEYNTYIHPIQNTGDAAPPIYNGEQNTDVKQVKKKKKHKKRKSSKRKRTDP